MVTVVPPAVGPCIGEIASTAGLTKVKVASEEVDPETATASPFLFIVIAAGPGLALAPGVDGSAHLISVFVTIAFTQASLPTETSIVGDDVPLNAKLLPVRVTAKLPVVGPLCGEIAVITGAGYTTVTEKDAGDVYRSLSEPEFEKDTVSSPSAIPA